MAVRCSVIAPPHVMTTAKTVAHNKFSLLLISLMTILAAMPLAQTLPVGAAHPSTTMSPDEQKEKRDASVWALRKKYLLNKDSWTLEVLPNGTIQGSRDFAPKFGEFL